MAALLATLPMQLVCQLIVSGAPGFNETNIDANNLLSQVPTAPLPDGYIAYPDIGVAYKLHSEAVSWKIARKRCLEEGAQLALVDSPKKLEYVKRERKSQSLRHVGIHSLFGDDEWVSVSNGAPVNSIPWSEGEPNNGWDCVMVEFRDGGLGNYGCSNEGDYVCEIPIPKSQTANLIPAN